MDIIEILEGTKKRDYRFGVVFLHGVHVYRAIDNRYKKEVNNFVSNSSLMNKLHKKGLIETFVASVSTKQHSLVLEHKKIDFDSYINEWPLTAKIDAAVMIIDLLQELIEEGWCLWDGHPYNVLFDFTEPKWIDFHSIIPFTPITAWWEEYRGYIFNQVVNDSSAWEIEKKLLSSTLDAKEGSLLFLKNIKEIILNSSKVSTKTPWFDYPRLGDIDLDDKQIGTMELLKRVKPYCDTFLDIGGNVGWYSRRASRMGYKVVITDVDEACIAESYTEAKNSGDNVLSLVADFKDCLDVMPGHYLSFADRLSCDVSLSLALLHHLVFFQECDFPFIAKRLDALSNKAAIVQFITREDSYVKNWIKTGTKNYDWYTMDNFILEMGKYFSTYEVFESVPKGRKLILFEKKEKI